MNKIRYNLKKRAKKKTKYTTKHDPWKNFRRIFHEKNFRGIFRKKKMYPAEEASVGSSATTKCSLQKKVLQDLPRDLRKTTFFHWITRKILQNLLLLDHAEDPAESCSAGIRGRTFHTSSAWPRGRTPSSATVPKSHFHTCGRRIFSRKNLFLQPPPPQVTNVVYPKVSTTIYAIQIDTRRLED